jgi:methylmalonyl-CoA mutase cobalamin-binding subunit
MAPANEQHGIAVAMLADFLRAGGFEVHHLGVNVPADDLHLFLQVVPCDLLCVSVTTPGADAAVYRDVVTAATNGSSPLVIFGGRGADPAHVAAVSALHVDTLTDVVPRVDEVMTDLVSVSPES